MEITKAKEWDVMPAMSSGITVKGGKETMVSEDYDR